ncbi:hypothetical protein [Roseburia sp. MSJ-14]|uniref:hypothetical protein n=1 Tax=Roseburia sp. MSJ-14 TaxID=2841514 RepID=UPI002ED278D0
MELKLAKKSDTEKVYALVQDTIKVVYPKYYLKEIVDMFCEFHSRENIIKDIEAGNTYIFLYRDLLWLLFTVPEKKALPLILKSLETN